MMRLDARALERLSVIGVDVWTRREATPVLVPEALSESSPGRQEDEHLPRVRLSSGDGDWLLVQRRPWRGSHEKLLADLIATIGQGRVRFGQWATGSASGELLDELPSRGIRHVLSLGAPPVRLDSDSLLVAAELDTLASDGDARRELWRSLAPKLGY